MYLLCSPSSEKVLVFYLCDKFGGNTGVYEPFNAPFSIFMEAVVSC